MSCARIRNTIEIEFSPDNSYIIIKLVKSEGKQYMTMRILEQVQPFFTSFEFCYFFGFYQEGKKVKSQYLNEVKNGCTRSRIRNGI